MNRSFTLDSNLGTIILSVNPPGMNIYLDGKFVCRTESEAKSRDVSKRVNLQKPALPEGMDAGGHGGSHGYLGNDFVEAILGKKKPLVDIRMALNLSVSGYFAHMSALKDGETMKIPQFA